MKFKNKLHLFIASFLLFIVPITGLAYSNYIIPGGETIGIEVNSKGVLVVGFYKVGDNFIGKEAGFEIGDIITKVNNTAVSNIDEMVDIVTDCDGKATFNILRSSKNINLELNLKTDDKGILKTGLYVKDKINGIGTLTYVDPKSRVFGALGHEIVENTTISKFEIKDGLIYDANVSGIIKSRNGKAGEKNAVVDKNTIEGEISTNEISGIFGTYSKTIDADTKTIEVAGVSDIKLGEAIIRTVITEDKVEEFKINIMHIDPSNKTKNILFEVTDERLINETGGIVQGMSGSPIIQNNKIIGAVNYVIVNDTTKGYGIFITTMLEEGDR